MGDITTEDDGSMPNTKMTEYPADTGDTTESDNNADTGEVDCACGTHPGKKWLDKVFPLKVDQLFTYMFTGSKFMADLLESRKTTDVVMSPWELDNETGHKTRKLSYTLFLNTAMAKTAPSSDNQTLLKESKAGKKYIICCEIANSGVPYCDAFSVQSRYCLTRVSASECRLQLHSLVNYKKSLWGVVKSMIDKTAMQGVQDFVKDLNIALKREEEQSQVPGKKRRPPRHTTGGSKAEEVKEENKVLPSQSSQNRISPSVGKVETGGFGLTAEFVIKVILGILGTLLILNVMLFYKMWALEDQTAQIVSVPAVLEIPLDSKGQSSENLLKLLRQQEGLHRAEVKKWGEMITDILNFLKTMETSFSELKNKVDSFGDSAYITSTGGSQVKAEKQ